MNNQPLMSFEIMMMLKVTVLMTDSVKEGIQSMAAVRSSRLGGGLQIYLAAENPMQYLF